MRHFLRKYLLLAILLAGVFFQTMAQPKHPVAKTKYAGKDFWLALQNVDLKTEFYITGQHNATITFTYTTTNASQSYTMQAGSVLRVPMTQMNLACATALETVQNRSLHMVSDSNVVINFVSWGGFQDDGILLYPSDRQQYGKEYYLNGLPSLLGGYMGNLAGGFTIVATCDDVTLEITPKKSLPSHPAAIPFQIHLNKGEIYTITNAGSNQLKDLSGTKIKVIDASCCNPINVFNTGLCAYSYWPYSGTVSTACDSYLDQVLPVSSWDTLYHLVPYANSPYSVIKIVSSAGNNVISMNGTVFATLADGGTLDTIISRPAIITSSYPVSISQHMPGMSVAYTNPNPVSAALFPVDSMGDPNTAMAVPLRDGIREAYFHTIGASYIDQFGDKIFYNKYHMLTLISTAANINTITLNNNPVAAQFQPFPGTPSYMFAYIKPDTGIQYHLRSADPVIAYYYAGTMAGSLDCSLGDINPTVFFNELPTDTLVACNRDTNLLEGGPGFIYEWSTQESTPDIKVADTGLYYVLKHFDDDCIGELKSFVVKRPPTYLTDLNLGEDTTICQGKTLTLLGQGTQTIWSTGETGASIKVEKPGTYWATVTDTCTDYRVTDTIVVQDTLCLDMYCRFQFPNAFSPNGDGLNDILKPVYYGALDQYILLVYNRWGQRVFNSSRLDNGWDGYIQGAPADQGVYFYQYRYYCPVRGYVEAKGDISLIR